MSEGTLISVKVRNVGCLVLQSSQEGVSGGSRTLIRSTPLWRLQSVLAMLAALLLGGPLASAHAASLTNTNPPAQPLRLFFIHHSTGENWLHDDYGGLGVALRDNRYYVSDSNYGWGPDVIGDTTDIGHWYTWFRGPQSATYMAAVFAASDQNCSYSRLASAPAGANGIVLFKSCFPNSNLNGDPDAPVPSIGSNPLRGANCYSEHHTVANAKGIYMDLLNAFATHTNTLFVAIAAPPVSDSGLSANARAFNNWLANDWLSVYAHRNVFVFDFYNVLTSNGGSPGVGDAGSAAGNHHRWWQGAVQHKTDDGANVTAYASAPNDDHPNAVGSRKATAEFVPLLNAAVNAWLGVPSAPRFTGMSLTPPDVTLSIANLSPECSYTLWLSTNDLQGGWHNVDVISGVTATNWSERMSSQGTSFYRLSSP